MLIRLRTQPLHRPYHNITTTDHLLFLAPAAAFCMRCMKMCSLGSIIVIHPEDQIWCCRNGLRRTHQAGERSTALR